MRVLADTLAIARAWLAAHSDVTALVGSRSYAGRLPATPTFPAVRLTRIGSTVEQDHAKLDATRIQVDCWGSGEYEDQEAFTLAATVHAALIGMRDYSPSGGFVTDVQTIAGPQSQPDVTYNRSRYVFDVRVWTLPKPA